VEPGFAESPGFVEGGYSAAPATGRHRRMTATAISGCSAASSQSSIWRLSTTVPIVGTTPWRRRRTLHPRRTSLHVRTGEAGDLSIIGGSGGRRFESDRWRHRGRRHHLTAANRMPSAASRLGLRAGIIQVRRGNPSAAAPAERSSHDVAGLSRMPNPKNPPVGQSLANTP
jgi:hypothetical protein